MPRALACLLSIALLPAGARAQEAGFGASSGPAGETVDEEGADEGRAESDDEDDDDDGYGATGRVRASPATSAGDATSVVARREIEERLPRSAPDALRYEPGVYIQQTAHGQASPYVRGMTGQQVVHVFDGVRMNNGIYRQGPNQYFFTVDSRSVRSLEVIRGSASTRWGSDALGGAILADPVAPFVDARNRGLDLHGRVYARRTSADEEWGGRAEVEARVGPRTAILAGAGYRDVGLLESGGVVEHSTPAGDGTMRGTAAPWVPRFAEEADHPDDRDAWRTQLGTGFREVTADGRLVHEIEPGTERAQPLRAIAAAYAYRQLDAPRTDQCPPPEAPVSECLVVEKQYRTLAYLALRGDVGPELRDLDVTVSWQEHREARRRDRPRSLVRLDWEDRVSTWGLSARGATRPLAVGAGARIRLHGGLDVYADDVESEASQSFTDMDREFRLPRGQYLEGSTYRQAGVFAELELRVSRAWTLRGGGRLARVDVDAPADPESDTAAIDRTFVSPVGRAGVAWRAAREITLHLNVDQGFRAPNLDDLTSRQQTGPGFQFENPNLEPERTTTIELGAEVEVGWLELDAWAFGTILESAMVRAVREADDCPTMTPQCEASRNQLQLVNADGTAVIWGVEGGATAYLPHGFTARATVSWAWGEGPSTGARPSDPAFGAERVPLSRIPPLNGTVETRWRDLASGVYAAAAVRWAATQTRLAPTDRADARIPFGGTPGYAVMDLRAGIRRANDLRISLVLENLFDTAWRAHGSSVNGPGRGFIVEGMVGF